MKIFDGWALVSDLDGTLLHDSQLVSGNKEAIDRFEAAGGKFIMATGRSVAKAKQFAKTLECRYPSVVYNGAAVYDYSTERFLWTCTYQKAEVLSFFEKISKEFPKVGFVVHGREKLWVAKETEMSVEYALEETDELICADFCDIEDEWFKVLAVAPHDEIVRFSQYAEKHLPERLRATRSDSNYCEFLDKKVNKFFATSRILDMLSISLDKSCGIGDYYNDLELICETAVGACPASAPQGVRDRAPNVVAPCKDGAVADFVDLIEKRINKNLL